MRQVISVPTDTEREQLVTASVVSPGTRRHSQMELVFERSGAWAVVVPDLALAQVHKLPSDPGKSGVRYILLT